MCSSMQCVEKSVFQILKGNIYPFSSDLCTPGILKIKA